MPHPHLRTPRAGARGVALVTAMVIVAIAATAAAYLASSEHLWLRLVENLSESAQSETLRRAAFAYAAHVLERDAAESARDDLHERWALPIPPFATEGGSLHLAIEDAQGRFNLNNLVRSSVPSAPDIGVFQRLLALHGLEPALAEALVDWLDRDSHTRPGGAEDLAYLEGTPAYRAANQPLVSVEELRAVRGFDAEAVARLRAEVIALPQATEINVNTAPARVLAALVPNLSLAAAEALAARRVRSPFSSTEEFLAALPAEAGRPQAPISIASRYFLAHFEWRRHKHWLRRSVALIERPLPPKRAQLLWHAPQLVLTAAGVDAPEHTVP